MRGILMVGSVPVIPLTGDKTIGIAPANVVADVMESNDKFMCIGIDELLINYGKEKVMHEDVKGFAYCYELFNVAVKILNALGERYITVYYPRKQNNLYMCGSSVCLVIAPYVEVTYE